MPNTTKKHFGKPMVNFYLLFIVLSPLNLIAVSATVYASVTLTL